MRTQTWHILLEILEHSLHVHGEQLLFAQGQDGHGQSEDDLKTIDEETVHDTAGEQQRQRCREQGQEP